MTKQQANTLISKVWSEVEHALNNITHRNYGADYFRENIAEEKSHRGCGLPARDWGLSVPQAARLFAVVQLAEMLVGKNRAEIVSDVKNYLGSRKSIWTAASLVANYRAEIETAFALGGAATHTEAFDAILAMDYAELVKVTEGRVA
jgi:hypothetical protein